MTRAERLKLAKDSFVAARNDIADARHAYGAAPRTDIDEAFTCLCDAVAALTDAVEMLCELDPRHD